MSSRTSHPSRLVPDRPVERARRVVSMLRNHAPSLSPTEFPRGTRLVRWIAFWAAIALPFVLLALLLRGLATTTGTLAFVTLLSANLVALVVGHAHRRE